MAYIAMRLRNCYGVQGARQLIQTLDLKRYVVQSVRKVIFEYEVFRKEVS